MTHSSPTQSTLQEPPKKSQEPRHYHYIDALRCWAFLAVVFTHVGEKVAGLPPRIATVAAYGGTGVQLFFVISAFTLISSHYARSRVEKNPTRNFFLRRFFRIAPLFYLGLLVYLPLTGIGPNRWTPEGVGVVHFLSVLTFLNGLYPTTFNTLVPGCWSIAVEMMFYVFVPFLVARITSGKRALWWVLITLIASLVMGKALDAIVGPHWQGGFAFPYGFYRRAWLVAQLPVFLLGFLLFFVLRKTEPLYTGRADKTRRSHSLILFCLFVVSLTTALSFPASEFLPDTIRFGFTYFLLAWSLALVPWKPLVNSVTQYLGTISFSGYLTHFSIVFFVLPWLLRDRLHSLPPIVQLMIWFMLAVAGTVPLATLTYRFVELPGIALGRKIIQRLEARV